MAKLNEKEDKEWSSNVMYSQHPSLRRLEPMEKQYLLAVERGDVVRVTRMLEMVNRNNTTILLDVNCKDPVGRSATLMAIDNENLEMLELLLEHGVESRDALLHAINAEYVEAVDLLLEHEEIIYKEGDRHSWEKVDRDISTFTAEITPLILAAHKDNYEILKILLDRGATLPMPHDVRCRCNDCVQAMEDDCLYHSRSRINAYRALSSPSLICLSSIDPILTAFELSWELRRLSLAENEFKQDYLKLRSRCQDFATALLDHARSSRELEMVLNYDPTRPPYQHGDHMPLARLEMAIKYKQKKFIAHPNVQQLLSALWYDGLPGFRRQNPIYQLWDIIKIGVLFPFYSVFYMLFPNTSAGQLVRKPFFKFIIHSFSYLFFLLLLILASQRVETLITEWFGSEEMRLHSHEALKRQRGQLPSILETTILLYIIAHIWQETRELWTKGLVLYFHNLWNIIDFTRNSLYVGTAGMRLLAYFQAQTEIANNPMAVYIPREAWDAYDPMLIADGLFAAGNVFAALKLVHIFSINPYLGPLQISLGRMVIDIIKFFFIYALVLFAFACGLNQLLWYYADMEKQQCFSGPGGTENWTHQRDSCLAWRRFSNLFESSQTLFWASFGLVDISNFELTGIKSYTRFWGLLMFGSYSVINVVVLLNLLIAMMSNSYNIISERADVEWKFARTTLFMNYFEEGATVPPPFNIFPTFKHLLKLFGKKKSFKDMSFRKKEFKMKERDTIYQSVMCNLVWRYVTAQQKENESHPVTEDNINELRQDVYSFRYDLMRVLKGNGMNTREIEKDKIDVSGKRVQIRKRRLIKDFSIGLMEVCTDEAAPEVMSNKSMLARLVGLSGNETRGSQRWRDLIQAAKKSKIIGNRDSESGRFGSIKRNQTEKEEEQEETQVSYIEFQKEAKNDNNYSTPGSNLYPQIPEEDLAQSILAKKGSPIISQPKSYIPETVKLDLQKQAPNQDKRSPLLAGIKLSPDALIKHSMSKAKDVKYQAPSPMNVSVSKEIPVQNNVPMTKDNLSNEHVLQKNEHITQQAALSKETFIPKSAPVLTEALTPKQAPVPKEVFTPKQAPVHKEVFTTKQAPVPKEVLPQKQAPVPKENLTPKSYLTTPVPKEVLTPKQYMVPKEVLSEKQAPVPKEIFTPKQAPISKDIIAPKQAPVSGEVLIPKQAPIPGHLLTPKPITLESQLKDALGPSVSKVELKPKTVTTSQRIPQIPNDAKLDHNSTIPVVKPSATSCPIPEFLQAPPNCLDPKKISSENEKTPINDTKITVQLEKSAASKIESTTTVDMTKNQPVESTQLKGFGPLKCSAGSTTVIIDSVNTYNKPTKPSTDTTLQIDKQESKETSPFCSKEVGINQSKDFEKTDRKPNDTQFPSMQSLTDKKGWL